MFSKHANKDSAKSPNSNPQFSTERKEEEGKKGNKTKPTTKSIIILRTT